MVTEPTEAAMSQPCPPGKRWSKSQQRFVQDLSFKKKNRKGKTTDGQAIGLDEQLKRPQYIAKTDDISSSLNLGGYASGFESDHWNMPLPQEPSPEPCSAKSAKPKRGPESRGNRGTKIFIRGLGKDTDKQQLKDFFDSLGAPLCFF